MFKNKPAIILGIAAFLLFILNISSCFNAYNQNAGRRKEMAQRMDLEEKMSKFTQEKAVLSAKLQATEKSQDEEKAADELTKKALAQEELVTQSLKDELQKVTKLKEALEENLKQAVAKSKKANK